MSEFVISLKDLEETAKSFSFPIPAGWLVEELDDTPLRPDGSDEPGQVTLQAQLNGKEVLIDGQVEASLRVACCRCLEDFPLPVRTPLVALLSTGAGTDGGGLVELTAEDLDRAVFDGTEVVLDALVREHLVLECPMQPVCSADCPGIDIPEHVRPPEADFGAEAQKIDPRFAALEKLRDKVPKKE